MCHQLPWLGSAYVFIAWEDIECQRLLSFVDEANSVVQVADRHDGQQGPEDLLLHDPGMRGDVLHHSGGWGGRTHSSNINAVDKLVGHCQRLLILILSNIDGLSHGYSYDCKAEPSAYHTCPMHHSNSIPIGPNNSVHKFLPVTLCTLHWGCSPTPTTGSYCTSLWIRVLTE